MGRKGSPSFCAFLEAAGWEKAAVVDNADCQTSVSLYVGGWIIRDCQGSVSLSVRSVVPDSQTLADWSRSRLT